MTLFEASLTIVGAMLTGGVGVSLLNRVGMSKKDQGDYLLMLVKQLQENVNTNNEEIKSLKSEVHQWREKYYAELQEKDKLSEQIRKMSQQLQKFNNQLS